MLVKRDLMVRMLFSTGPAARGSCVLGRSTAVQGERECAKRKVARLDIIRPAFVTAVRLLGRKLLAAPDGFEYIL